MLSWCVIMVMLVFVYRNFGQGLKESGKYSVFLYVLNYVFTRDK